jgi:hypothetical protein
MRAQSAADVPKLLTLGTAAIQRNTWSAARWLGAAVAMAPAEPDRTAALAAYAKATCLLGDYGTAALSSRELLDSGVPLAPDLALETQLVHVTALWGLGDLATMSALVSGARTLSTAVAHQAVVRAAALCFQGRWDEAYGQLDKNRAQWAVAPEATEFGTMVLAAAGAITGRPAEFQALLDRLYGVGPLPRSHPIMLRMAVRVLLTVGDTRAARELLTHENLDVAQLPALDRALLAWEQGGWDEALHHARMDSSTADVLGPAPSPAVVGHAVAAIMLGRGRIAAARSALAAGREASPALVQMLDVMDAAVAIVMGDTEQAQRHVEHGLAYVRSNRIVPGAADLWVCQAELALARGDRDTARQAVDAARQAADEQRTDRSRLLALLAITAADPDPRTSAEAVRLARRVGQPRTLARTLSAVVAAGHGDPAMLSEAYEILGDLGALLYRYRLRRLMRRYDVIVPRRAVTTAENDQLLATLVADGATNRELATVLQTSAKSVEGMLSRLFARTGYRSRVDLAAAMLSGEYPGL